MTSTPIGRSAIGPGRSFVHEVGEALEILDGRVWHDAVAEVEHVAVAHRRTVEHAGRGALHRFPRRRAGRGIEVPLDRPVGADALPRAVKRYAPVHADRVPARL